LRPLPSQTQFFPLLSFCSDQLLPLFLAVAFALPFLLFIPKGTLKNLASPKLDINNRINGLHLA
jgi:hypothetical protein